MADIISQDEINALIESYNATGGAEEAGKPGDRQLRLYDFARPDKFCKEHLRGLNLIHAKHGASFAISLAAMFRADIQVNLLALDQLTYREYCASVPDSALFAEVGLEPLTSIAIFELDPSLVAACVDLLAGGSTVSAITSSRKRIVGRMATARPNSIRFRSGTLRLSADAFARWARPTNPRTSSAWRRADASSRAPP